MANRKHTIYNASTGLQYDIPFTAAEEKARDQEEIDLAESLKAQDERSEIEKTHRASAVRKLSNMGLTTSELDALLTR